MKIPKNICATLLLLATAAATSGAEVIRVTVEDGLLQNTYTVDSQLASVRNLAEMYLRELDLRQDVEEISVEDTLGFPFELDKSLAESHVRDGSILRIKY